MATGFVQIRGDFLGVWVGIVSVATTVYTQAHISAVMGYPNEAVCVNNKCCSCRMMTWLMLSLLQQLIARLTLYKLHSPALLPSSTHCTHTSIAHATELCCLQYFPVCFISKEYAIRGTYNEICQEKSFFFASKICYSASRAPACTPLGELTALFQTS